MAYPALRKVNSRFSNLSNSETPYPSVAQSTSHLTLSQKYSLSADPQEWEVPLEPVVLEPDDDLHSPVINEKRMLVERDGNAVSWRGFANLGCLLILIVSIIGLFVGYPVTTYFTATRLSTQGGFNLGGLNASGQVPAMGNWGLIDLETPKDAYTKPSWNGGSDMQLVFSDEFNTDGRSFYPGDDPFWEAVDLHYWATNNMEWYDPEAVTTKNGSLVITLDRKENHDLKYTGGMMTTWNKFCFTGGYIESRVVLPGANNILGLWPAIWAMGNLGRAGYGASLDGTWPYTYDACDVGTVANQSVNGQPAAATKDGDKGNGGVLSFLPGQRLSRCTCPGESHPGPMHADGTYVGRAAPEIDIFEAQINEHTLIAGVSQSGQWAPFDESYVWQNTSQNLIIADPSQSVLNTFVGSVTQEATSVVTTTRTDTYEKNGGQFAIYGFEYKPGFDDSYITWISDNKVAWTIKGAGLAANPTVQISQRPVPQEPMYILANLGQSRNFGPVDEENMPYPVHMLIDYIRVYQPKDAINIGCNPKDFPTQEYINTYIEAYTNPNLTTWVDDYKQPIPKNKFLGEC